MTFAEMLCFLAQMGESVVTDSALALAQQATEDIVAFSRSGPFMDGKPQDDLRSAALRLSAALGIEKVNRSRADAGDVQIHRDSRLLCEGATDLDLRGLPEEFFNRDSVCFFSVLKAPFYRDHLPRLVFASEVDQVPVAVFDPSGVNSKNGLLVAAAMVAFAKCFGPAQASPTVS